MVANSRETLEEFAQRARVARSPGDAAALFEQAINVAEGVGDKTSAFQLRTELVSALIFAGHPERAAPHFAWCLQRCVDHPDLHDVETVVWDYKWFANKLCRFASVSAEQIESTLNEVSAWYRRIGWSQRAPHQLRMESALATGQLDKARAAFESWQAAPRDSGSDCEACEQDRQVGYHLALGAWDAARVTAKPILEGQLQCAEVPHLTLARMVVPLHSHADFDASRRAFQSGYALIRGGGDYLEAWGQHLEYAVLASRFDAAASIVQRHLPSALTSPDTLYSLAFLYPMCMYLRAQATPSIQLVIPPAMSWYRADNQYDVAQLQAWFEEVALSLARALDRRNGNDYYARKIHAAWGLE